TEDLKVVGPDASLVSVAGKNLVLPCFIKPSTSAVDMTVEWRKLDAKNLLVHLYKNHEDRNEDQAQSYRGRTSLFKEELQKGNASLKLSALRVSDEGQYHCRIGDESWVDDTAFYVRVEAQGSHPVIMMESYDNSGGINLVCESRGWNPEPEVLWLDREGFTLSAEETQIQRETEGFSVKRRITVHDYSSCNKFYCRFLLNRHMMEAEVIINSKVFNAWKFAVGISVPACITAVGLIITAAVFYKKEPQRRRIEQKLAKMKKSAVNVTLDPDTANPYLILSDDRKEVRDGNTWQNLPDTPQRFDYEHCVVGKQSFSSGRFYYEVQVSGKTGWILGVVRENINRKGGITESPQDGVWTVELSNENEYDANAGPDVPLTLREKVEKVGVFVDYEEGLVSFYDVNSRSHIYSFTGQSFTEKLYPYFYPWESWTFSWYTDVPYRDSQGSLSRLADAAVACLRNWAMETALACSRGRAVVEHLTSQPGGGGSPGSYFWTWLMRQGRINVGRATEAALHLSCKSCIVGSAGLSLQPEPPLRLSDENGAYTEALGQRWSLH
ncbi:butyrophilin subfamily 1 member A1-like, partial [Clarias gariepinus]|uniref:butyrophilin subfamily 1 member A1-like n=1 Tax=Clarias gariepinus TaxID=13013 RepID=UPI00234E097D